MGSPTVSNKLTDGSELKNLPDKSRRSWLGAALALGGAVLAPGVTLIQIGQAEAAQSGVGNTIRWGLLIDTTKCTPGCDACVKGCQTENGLPTSPGPTDSQWIRKIEIKSVSTGKETSLPVMCQHCAEPPCVDVCPTGASFKRADGIVLVDKHICIGCRYCVMACPFKARSFVHEPVTDQKPDVPRGKGTVEGCTLCVHRVDEGKQPACVQACSDAGYGAMTFGDLNDTNSEISKKVAKFQSSELRPDLRLNQGVRYHGI
jgi:tetrathionate reductase subunit B